VAVLFCITYLHVSISQNALDDGTLVHWSKEFSVTGVEGRDVVKLLQKALDNRVCIV
jgi:hexokinase